MKNFNRTSNGHIKGTTQTRKYYIAAKIRRIQRLARIEIEKDFINNLGRLNDLIRMFDNIETDTGQLTREQVIERYNTRLTIIAVHGHLRKFRIDCKRKQLNLSF